MKQQHRVNVYNNCSSSVSVWESLNRIVSKEFHGAQLETIANVTTESGEHTRLMRLSISNPSELTGGYFSKTSSALELLDKNAPTIEMSTFTFTGQLTFVRYHDFKWQADIIDKGYANVLLWTTVQTIFQNDLFLSCLSNVHSTICRGEHSDSSSSITDLSVYRLGTAW